MPRGGRRPGAGRPKLSKETIEERVYDKYLRRWNEAKQSNLYGMVDKPLSKDVFFEALADAKSVGVYHPIATIIREDVKFSRSQSRAWAKNLNKNLKEWRKGTDNEHFKDIVNIMGQDRFYVDSFFKMTDKKVSDVISIINRFDLWEEAVGS